MGFLCVLKIYHVRLLENRGLERLPDDVEFIPNININAENLPCLGFWNLLCMRMIGPAYACRKLHARPILTCM